ncbi:CoA transferase subunit A [Asanoa iriomotensis]|uniref:CoA-transferase n=1 Tax=Asanoa iriomotensis TaxID=234613 RepID=A0ABQ4BYW4_9ACTN|nr:CoA transferase subunit A [Asanoa iriomotensis]GIF55729.1 CoA-transferase [Asanoa iriomotensis]
MPGSRIPERLVSAQEAISVIPDGASVAIGGHTLRRHPMALVRELIRQRKRGLHLLGWNNGIDFDMLIGAGVAAKIETSYVGMGPLGLARNLRRHVESGAVETVDHSETTAIDMFRATALGVDFLPNRTPLGTDLMTYNDGLVEITSPFTGQTYAAVRGVEPDFVLLHAHSADVHGNVQLDEANWGDNTVDPFIGRAGKHVIVSVEEIVSTEHIRANPRRTFLPREYVTRVVHAPFGAHPCCADARYGYDQDELRRYYEASKTQETFEEYLADRVTSVGDHWEYLDKVGVANLLTSATHTSNVKGADTA